MAKAKKKGKKKGGAAKVSDAAEPEAPETGAEGDEGEEETDEEALAAEAEAAEPEPKKKRGRGGRNIDDGPRVDPNLPSPDGDRVSNSGGLVFVFVILGLIGVAIAAQFLMGG